MRVPSNRATALGDVSPWGRSFLQALQAENILDIGYEPSVQQFCTQITGINEAQILFIENQPESRAWILSVRQSGKFCYLVWYGRAFSKEDYQFALENRIYIAFENLRTDDQKLVDWLSKLTESKENSLQFAAIMRAVKGILVQTDQETLPKQIIPELKTAMTKIERIAGHNEYYLPSQSKGVETETKLPFHRTQEFSDALNTVAELERTGTLWIRGNLPAQEGKVEFLHGKVMSATAGDVRGVKAMFRIFLWDEPRFLFGRSEPNNFNFEAPLTVGLKYICDEGSKQKRRYEQIRRELPPLDLKLELEPSMLHKGTVLPTEDFPALASVVESGVVSHILDYNPIPDVDLYESLIRLRRNNILRVALSK